MTTLLLESLSPWPLSKLIYGYSSFRYSDSASVTLLNFYLFKVAFVAFFYVDEGRHPSWFEDFSQTSSDDVSSSSPPLSHFLFSAFVGDFIFLSLGMILASIQSSTLTAWFDNSKIGGFFSVSEWSAFFHAVVHRREYDVLYFDGVDLETVSLKTWNLWPLRRVFGIVTEASDCRWAHRKFIWFYVFQSLSMGAPISALYRIGRDSTSSVRIGTLIYLIGHVALLIAFYFLNKYAYKRHIVTLRTHLKIIIDDADDDDHKQKPTNAYAKTMHKKIHERGYVPHPSLFLFDATYAVWIITVIFLGLFASIDVGENSYGATATVFVAWGIAMVFTVCAFLALTIVDAIPILEFFNFAISF